MKRKRMKTNLTPIETGTVTVVSVPGADLPFFVYDRKTRKSSHGFKTLKAAEKYIKREFK